MKSEVYFLLDEGRCPKSSMCGISIEKKGDSVIINGWYDGNCSLGEETMSVDSFLSKLKTIGIEPKEAGR